MATCEIVPELNLKNIIAELREYAQATNEFADTLERIEKKYAEPPEREDCRDCKEFDDCPCGKEGHESRTSQGYSIGECTDFEPRERSDKE